MERQKFYSYKGKIQAMKTCSFFCETLWRRYCSLVTCQFCFVSDFSTTISNWRRMLQDIGQRCWGRLLFDLTLWSLEGVSFYEYLLILDPDFSYKGEQFGLLITKKVVAESVYCGTNVRVRQWKPVLILIL